VQWAELVNTFLCYIHMSREQTYCRGQYYILLYDSCQASEIQSQFFCSLWGRVVAL